mgnify:CR=1 FL=1
MSDDSFKESILFSCLKKGERIIIIQQHQCEITCNAFTIHIEIEMNSKEWNGARWHIGPYWPKMFINSVGLFIFLLAWLCNAAKNWRDWQRIRFGFLSNNQGVTWEILMKRFWFEGFYLIFQSLGWGIFLSSCGTKTNLNRQRVFIMCGSVRQFLWQIVVSKVSQVRVYNQSRRHNLIRWL